MKKFIKNKFVVLTVCVAIVSVLYFVAQKAIDEYSFKKNKDIITEEEGESNEMGTESNTDVSVESNINNEDKVIEQIGEDGTIPNEETDLVLEESEEVVSEDNSFEVDKGRNIQSKIYVYITGEVNVPGVLILNEGSRIVDAINAAGGTTAKANISKVNLVYVLDDGMKINIPNDNDLKNNANFEYITMNSGDGGNDDYAEEGESRPFSKNSSIVNINAASQTELETLPGIGPSLALKIINYRKENGKFSSIEQLKEVSGIGESKFESLKKYVTI